MPTESREVSDTVVAVTGADSGTGAVTAQLLLEAGAKIAVHARHREPLDALADEYGADDVLVVTGDVQNPDSAAELVTRAVEPFARLVSIVANVGIAMYGGILDCIDAELQTMTRTNVEGTVWAVRAAVAEFRRHPGAGGDVVVASLAGLRRGADEAVYAATKFARSARPARWTARSGPEEIRVTTICPTDVHTEFAIGAGRTERDPGLEDYLRPEDVAHAITTVLRQPRRVRTTQWQL
jgi:NADP-dependent 3-hydroxy acid dehydrogenase YdfG